MSEFMIGAPSRRPYGTKMEDLLRSKHPIVCAVLQEWKTGEVGLEQSLVLLSNLLLQENERLKKQFAELLHECHIHPEEEE